MIVCQNGSRSSHDHRTAAESPIGTRNAIISHYRELCNRSNRNRGALQMTTDAQQPEHYALTRWGLEEYYDALAHINGRAYADQMWERIERDTRTRPHTPAPASHGALTMKMMEKHDARIARTATLAILRQLESIDRNTNSYDEFENKVMDLIKSLRRTAQEHP